MNRFDRLKSESETLTKQIAAKNRRLVDINSEVNEASVRAKKSIAEFDAAIDAALQSFTLFIQEIQKQQDKAGEVTKSSNR